jgi:hypothetical protein
MKRIRLWMVVSVALVTLVLATGCKDDDNPAAPSGGGAMRTFSFDSSGQSLAISLSGGAVQARLIGGKLPYAIVFQPNPNIAYAALNHDTLTVIPIGVGSTALAIADSLGFSRDRTVAITITVTGSGGTNFGSGTVTATSSAGNLSITGSGAWPVQAGPSVIAMYDTSYHLFLVYGYRLVGGRNYDIVAVAAFIPSHVSVGTYAHPQITVGVAYNVDTRAVSIGL